MLITDWSRPGTAAMGRIPDLRVSQFWDSDRLISHAWGERGRNSIVWDDISIYAPGTLWQDRPPEPLFRGRTVVKAQDRARAALAQALAAVPQAP
ncbi:MAG TPA: hypothetical protein VGS58_05245 [Candidatus Sulfopaludibacter sp.]|nr:hypothetical protein [Candidatus Sulfopaludibacter sp.]